MKSFSSGRIVYVELDRPSGSVSWMACASGLVESTTRTSICPVVDWLPSATVNVSVEVVPTGVPRAAETESTEPEMFAETADAELVSPE